MAFGTNGFFGWLNHHQRTKAFVKLTGAQGGDNTGSTVSSDPQGVAWAELHALVGADGINPVGPTNALPVSGGGGGGSGAPYAATPKGYQQISAATLAASTALTVPGGATYAVVIPEVAGVRYRDDGVAPTGAVGMPVSDGEALTISGAAELSAIRFIAQTGQSPVLNISYYA